MIPKNVEEVLDPKNRISEYADYHELKIWMDWMNYAVQKASEDLAEAKVMYELAESQYNVEYATQYETIEADDVTTRKMKATICKSVIEKQEAMIFSKYKLNMAIAAVEGIKTRDNCIKKIITLRANSFTSYDDSDDKNKNNKSFSEQPYSSSTFNNKFMQ
ncbi:MAG: hypothetical protein M0Q13_13325 [Methanothrix sp.]|jgi:tRNA(Ile)-lysidine synthase TilS/MesJ|nr:hypothetical protein [Methanothrix sp.]